MKTKRCKICGKIKPLDEFYVNKGMADGYLNICKECVRERSRQYQQEHKEYRKEYIHKWATENKDKIKDYRQNNSDKVKIWKDRDYLKHKEEYIERAYNYYNTHKPQILEREKIYMRQRRKTDIGFKILCNLRGRINHAIRYYNKSTRTKELVGCSLDELKTYLESKFKDGMTWDSYGFRGWHIDHIIPCATFDLTKPEEQKKCFNYKNLQPLWAEDNFKKGARILDTMNF